MDWSLSEVIALANHECLHCKGLGLRADRKGVDHPCDCVLRNIFRACYQRFRSCVQTEKRISRVQLDWSPSSTGKRFYSRKVEEYIADFLSVSRRALDPKEHRIFRYHFILGADSRLCCRQLNLDRGTFFYFVYRIEAKLGRVYRELEPYGLYPLDEYFGGQVRTMRRSPRLDDIVQRMLPADGAKRSRSSRFPLRKIA